MINRNIQKRLNATIEALRQFAPNETFASMTVDQLMEKTRPSTEARKAIESANRARSGGIAERKMADIETRKLLKRVRYAVLANPNHGPNSPLYRALGYRTDEDRDSGLTFKSDSPDASGTG